MNGSATVSPVHVQALCCCGHDRRVHIINPTVSTTDQCTYCSFAGSASYQFHRYTAASEISPRLDFALMNPQRFANAGEQGVLGRRSARMTLGTVTVNATTINIPAAQVTIGGVIPRAGDVLRVQGSTGNRNVTFRILSVAGTSPYVVTVNRPVPTTMSGPFAYLNGADGGAQGAARPPNGQRAG